MSVVRIFLFTLYFFVIITFCFSQTKTNAEKTKSKSIITRIVRKKLQKKDSLQLLQPNDSTAISSVVTSKKKVGKIVNTPTDTLKPPESRSDVETGNEQQLQQILNKFSGDTTANEQQPQYEANWIFRRKNRQVSIIINNDMEYTKSRDVKLNIVAPGANYIMVSNYDDFTDGQWIEESYELNWMLPERKGYQRVYFKMMYPDSSVSEIYYDEIIADLTPPIASFTISPDSGIANETLFNFDATDSYHNFEIYLRWDWNGDGNYDTDWQVSKKEVHKYQIGGGIKYVGLEVKTKAGWYIQTNRQVRVGTRPEAKFGFSQKFENPLQITFNATESYDFEDRDAIRIRWDFDEDGTWDTAWMKDRVVTKTFKDFHNKKIRMQVIDSDSLDQICEQEIINNFYRMSYIEAGPFKMGSSEFEVDEAPVHEVRLDGYWIDKYPVTNSQYATFLNDSKVENEKPYINLYSADSKIYIENSRYVVEPGFEDHPVIDVSWNGALAYAEFCGKSLPTEAEWEKVARGTDERIYPWGNEMAGVAANYWDSGDDYDNSTTPVGYFANLSDDSLQLRANSSPYGVYDLVDNVREWCYDWYQRDYYSESPAANPFGPETGTQKVVRGGGYLFYSNSLRTTFRSSYEPTTTKNYIGFRCVIRRENVK